jgi:hypothetical protein
MGILMSEQAKGLKIERKMMMIMMMMMMMLKVKFI